MSKDAKKPATPEKPAPAQTPAELGGPSRAATIAVWSLIGAYVLVYLGISLVKWRYFLYEDFDLAIYAQSCRQILHGSLYSPILNVNLLGNHMSLLMVLLAPFYFVAPSPVTLLTIQTIVLALGALPVWWLARRELKNELAGVCFAALYLLFPALGYTNLYQFHPETLAAPFLLFAFWYLRTGRLGWMALFATLALLTKEDVTVVVGAMGLYALAVNVPRRWLYAATLCGLAFAFLILAFVIVMPAVNKGEVQLEKIYSQWGPTTGDALKAMAKDPVRVAREFFTSADPTDAAAKREYYLQMLLPVMLLALASPLTLLIALPAVAQHILSGRVNDHAIVYHYTSCVTPFVIAASVLGLRNLLSLISGGRFGALSAEAMSTRTPARTLGELLSVTAVVFAMTTQFLFGPFGFGVMQTIPAAEPVWPTPYQRALGPCMRGMLDRVPAGEPVAAGFRFMPHVADRAVTYSLHHIYKGTHTMSDKPYPIPTDIAAVAMEADSWIYLTFTRWDGGERLRKMLELNRLSAVDSAGDALLFLRDAKAPVALWETGDLKPGVARRVDYNDQISLVGYDAPATTDVAPGGRVSLRTFWRRIGDVRDQPAPRTFYTRGGEARNVFYLTQFALWDDEGRILRQPPRRIGYTFFPAHDWPMGPVVAERYEFIVPMGVRAGAWTLGMRVVEDAGRQLSLAEFSDDGLRRTDGFIPLGRLTIGAR